MKSSDLQLNKVKSQLSDMANKISCEFLIDTDVAPWIGAPVVSGTKNGSTTAEAKHPGIVTLKSSTSANSGYKFDITTNQIYVSNGLKATLVFKTPSILSGTTIRFGFHDSSDATEPYTGIYTELSGGVIVGKTGIDGNRSTTTSNYTLSSNTWYRLVIELNASTNLATYILYEDDSNNVLWSSTLATNIPLGRTTTYRIVATNSGTTAINLIFIDYIDIVFFNARRVV